LDGVDTGLGYGDRYPMTFNNETRQFGIAWFGAPNAEFSDHIAHEMGHGFGVFHSSGPYTATYDSGWDVMSDGQDIFEDNEDRRDFPFGNIPTHTIAAHKDFLGWIPAARKFTLAPGKRSFVTLARLGDPGTTGKLMAQVPIQGSSTMFYTVELRQPLETFDGATYSKVSYDDGTPAPSGATVVIHKVDYSLEDRHAQVVDADGDGDPNDSGAQWQAGETFTDPANGVTIEVNSIDRNAGTAVITVDNRPRITITDVTVTEPAAPSSTAPARFTVNLSNASTETIGLDYFTSAGTATKDVDYVHTANHLSIPPGTRTATITVSVKIDTVNESNETFFVDLKNPIGATLADSQGKGTIVNRAPAPSPTPVPCPPPGVNCQEP
jgi:hypothetical protein